jgi:hypothetical protein
MMLLLLPMAQQAQLAIREDRLALVLAVRLAL